jgi:hypothetical protein
MELENKQDATLQPAQAAPDATTSQAATTFQMPENLAGKSAEEIAKDYVELRTKLDSRESVQKQLEQMGGLDNLRQWAMYGNQAYQQAVQAQQQAQQRQPAQQTQQVPVGDPYADWDTLTPKEQAQKLSNLVASAATQYINQYGEQAVKAYAQQINDQLSGMNRQWEIFQKANRVWRKNPNVDIDTLLGSMAKMATADLDSLIDAAMNQAVGPAEIEAKVNAEVQRRLAEQKLKDQNQQVNVLAGASRAPFTMPDQPKNKAESDAAIFKSLLEKGIITPGHV